MTNPAEIIVVQLRQDGIHSSCAAATPAEKASYLADAAKVTGSNIVVGGLDDMLHSTIESLTNTG